MEPQKQQQNRWERIEGIALIVGLAYYIIWTYQTMLFLPIVNGSFGINAALSVLICFANQLLVLYRLLACLRVLPRYTDRLDEFFYSTGGRDRRGGMIMLVSGVLSGFACGYLCALSAIDIVFGGPMAGFLDGVDNAIVKILGAYFSLTAPMVFLVLAGWSFKMAVMALWRVTAPVKDGHINLGDYEHVNQRG